MLTVSMAEGSFAIRMDTADAGVKVMANQSDASAILRVFHGIHSTEEGLTNKAAHGDLAH